MANEQMLMGLLKTPSQVRRDEQQRMMEESMARSQQMLTRGGTTALPGIISAYGAQAAQRGTEAGAGLLRGISGGIGSMVGGETGQRIADLGISAEERQARSAQQVLQNVDQTDPDALEQAAQELARMGLTGASQVIAQRAQALRLSSSKIQTEQAKQANQLASTQQTLKETEMLGRLEPREVANLYKSFTPDSIDTYLAGEGPLVPFDAQTRNALSTIGKQLQDAGYEPGTPQFEAQMKIAAQKNIDAIGTTKTVNQMSSMEQVGFLKDSIESDPLFKNATVREDKINLANGALPRAQKGDAEAITVLQRTLSDLFNSDTRAASEIERFVTGNKSLLRAFNDLLSVKIYGELSTDQLSSYQQILKAVTDVTEQQKEGVLQKNINLFGEELSAEAVERIKNEFNQSVGVDDNDRLGIR